ncbi:Lrp/AsnC family transcriptional regulator [Altererythrobacter sp. FM1]|uniref:Lrp/AsnC family transcriptional regulator n=1 Tax=Tsuneonella flava TaxID=2055955 RepID=UPI000C7FA58B|nr:Lrp/AsnC family transcriptional regulator [Tsuneonella flava]ROT97582.1 Lrp/AsnC family transcriptional regulator [Altererythrobacter sp. FM1]
MDETDRRILRAAQAHPDLAIAELAEKAGLSHTPCWRRLKKLEETGIISGRAVLLDPKRLGLVINVFANLQLKQHDEETLDALEQAIHIHPEIIEGFSMSGSSDYVLRVVAKSVEDYERFLKKVLLHLPGVSSINSSFALKTIKMTTVLPV